jgi:hypothetical protein
VSGVQFSEVAFANSLCYKELHGGLPKKWAFITSYLDDWHINWHIDSFNASFLSEVRYMNAYPFSIFKRADRTCYSVSFKDAKGKFFETCARVYFALDNNIDIVDFDNNIDFYTLLARQGEVIEI